jgi:hypothetical protein
MPTSHAFLHGRQTTFAASGSAPYAPPPWSALEVSEVSSDYVPGITACMIAAGLIVVTTLLLNLKFWLANKRADRGGKIIEGLEGFRYTL